MTVPRSGAVLLAALLGCAWASAQAGEPTSVATYAVNGGAIDTPLTASPGDPGRGRQIVLDRASGNCLICHKVPDMNEPFQGDVGPDLSGVGARLSSGEIRLHIVDGRRLAPASIMPPYHRVDNLTRVAPEWRGKPVLDAQSVEDVVAYLSELK